MVIDVAFCVNDGYADYILVCIKSICENNRNAQLRIHVLTDHMSAEKVDRLNDVVADYDNVSLKVYIVDDTHLRGLKDTWSIYTWYRVLLPDVLPTDVHRVLYLDADTLVLGDLSELFTIDMTDHPIAGVVDIEIRNDSMRRRCSFSDSDIYICAGVMLMNLDYWREHALAAKVVEWGRANDALIKFPDQDTINILCRDTKIVLPIRFGIQEVFYYVKYFFDNYSDQLRDGIERPVIVHYAGCAPWIMEFSNHMYHDEWMRYSRMLSQPVLPKYSTKGLNKYKVMLWRWLNTRSLASKRITKQKVLQRLNAQ